jgi:hypothetical protein
MFKGGPRNCWLYHIRLAVCNPNVDPPATETVDDNNYRKHGEKERSRAGQYKPTDRNLSGMIGQREVVCTSWHYQARVHIHSHLSVYTANWKQARQMDQNTISQGTLREATTHIYTHPYTLSERLIDRKIVRHTPT